MRNRGFTLAEGAVVCGAICLVLAFVLAPFLVTTDASWSSMTSYGSQFKVTVYSGATPVKTYISTGKVMWHEGGGGCEFRDAVTKRHVRVAGTVTAEEL